MLHLWFRRQNKSLPQDLDMKSTERDRERERRDSGEMCSKEGRLREEEYERADDQKRER